MIKRSGRFYFSVLMLLGLLLNLTGPLTVYADEATPPPATQGNPATAQPQDDKQPAVDSPVGGTNNAVSAPAQAGSDQSASSGATSSDAPSLPQPGATQSTSGSASSAASKAASAPSVADDNSGQAADKAAPILQQVPDGTSLVVLNQDGSVEPLVTQQASQIIANSDPVWCPTGQTPGAVGCTPNQASITDLLTYVQNPSNNITGSGTIYFQNGAYGGTETSISLNGASLANLTNLALEGGWDLTTNSQVAGGVTTFSVPVSVINWLGNVSVTNINVTATDLTAALTVTTSGDINLSNVDAGGNTSGDGAYLNNCVASSGSCTGTGNVTVTDSSFNNNNGSGIYTQSAGNITLTNTDAQTNGYYGGDLVNTGGTGDVQVTNGTFSNNDDVGLSAILNGTVTQDTVTADANNTGSIVDTGGNVTVTNSTYDNNTWTGAQVTSGGDVSVNQTFASNNSVTGADLNTTSGTGGITVTNSTFNHDASMG